MSSPADLAWQPNEILRFVQAFDTGADAVLVHTDAGDGYLKAMGNRGGEHVLACEWVATQLARWLGLSTFDFALIEVTDVPDIPLANGELAKTGPAFITRAEQGQPWSGKPRELKRLINPQDISRLVVFDTWTLNCDRHGPKDDGGWRINFDNVFLSEEAIAGKLLLKAMDHTHCFTCGGDLTAKIARIERVKDERVFGLFKPFRRYLDRSVVGRTIQRIRDLNRKAMDEIVQTIPKEWDVSPAARRALVDLIVDRAKFVADDIIRRLWPQDKFKFMDESENQP